MDQVVYLEYQGGFRSIKTYNTGWNEFIIGERKNLFIDINRLSNASDFECIANVIKNRFAVRNQKCEFIDFDKYLFEHAKTSRYQTEAYREAHGNHCYPISNYQDATEIAHDLKYNIMTDPDCHYILYGIWVHEICYLIFTMQDAAMIVDGVIQHGSIKDRIKSYTKWLINKVFGYDKSGMRKLIERRNRYISAFK